jgi:hypothetical protein
MEHALRAVAMDAHVRANLWVRNGLSIHDMVWVNQTGRWIVLLLAFGKKSDPFVVVKIRFKKLGACIVSWSRVRESKK